MTAARRRTAGSARTQRPWWLGHEVHCSHCCLHHALHVEVRCSRCDGAVCRDCVVTVRETLELVCPACTDAEGD